MLKIELMLGQVQQNVQNFVNSLQFNQIQMNLSQNFSVFRTGKGWLL